MNTTPTSERTSSKGLAPMHEELVEIDFQDRSSRPETLLNTASEHPTKIPIHFCGGSGYAGTFPSSASQLSWPGPHGGTFYWLSSGEVGEEYLQSGQTVKLHRLELKLEREREEDTSAFYSCRDLRLPRKSPALSFLKKLFTDPKKSLVHPGQTITGLAIQKRVELCLLADFPFGALGGRDARPVIWNSFRGTVHEFDPKSLKLRGDSERQVFKDAHVSKEPIYDESTGMNLILQRSETGTSNRFSQYRLLVLAPNIPRILTFMGPKSLSLDLLASEASWCICSVDDHNHGGRRLFYLLNRQEGRLMAVYQSASVPIKKFVRLTCSASGNVLELLVLLDESVNGSRSCCLRKYTFSGLAVETARFDGAAGLLTDFPVADFESVCEGPFDQVVCSSSGLLARSRSTLLRLDDQFTVAASRSFAPLSLSDFSWFPMASGGGGGKDQENSVIVSTIGLDPYTGVPQLILIDSEDLLPIAKISLPAAHTANKLAFSPLIYLTTKTARTNSK